MKSWAEHLEENERWHIALTCPCACHVIKNHKDWPARRDGQLTVQECKHCDVI